MGVGFGVGGVGAGVVVVVDPPPGLLDNKRSACRLVHGEKIPFEQNKKNIFKSPLNVSPEAPERSETTLR